MDKIKNTYPVVIAGGGPVGLYLAIVLQQRGIDCAVFERKRERSIHSRSLGIHPVSLELMEEAGLVERFLDEGIKIREGIAFGDRGKIGTLSFATCPGPYRFVLALPQFKTELLLEQKLHELDPAALFYGTELTGIEESDESVRVTVSRGGTSHTLECDFLVGCDGKDSFVRQAAGFAFEGKTYPDTYIMGDFSDNTIFESRAAIFLVNDGLIESFPLPSHRRRWVVKVDNYLEEVQRFDLERRIAKRIGHDLGEEEHYMLSSFRVQKLIARPMARNRIFLAGDAAHIVSPVGGQGMNLGWLDARALADTLAQDRHMNSVDPENPAGRYSRFRTAAARKAIRRAEMNMKLGRRWKLPFVKRAIVRLMLKTPLQRFMARLFTMRGLNRWPV